MQSERRVVSQVSVFCVSNDKGHIRKMESVSYHETKVGIQVLSQEPGHQVSLNVPHKKTMMLARLKQKARSKRWSRITADSDVMSSSCWAMSSTCHSSPTEEATKCSSYISWTWSGTGKKGRD